MKELETQLETLKEENWKNNNIWRENYERLEEELDSTRSELHNLSFSRRGDEYAGKTLSWMINIILCNKDICIYIYAEN